jgi:hypothetical protein
MVTNTGGWIMEVSRTHFRTQFHGTMHDNSSLHHSESTEGLHPALRQLRRLHLGEPLQEEPEPTLPDRRGWSRLVEGLASIFSPLLTPLSRG